MPDKIYWFSLELDEMSKLTSMRLDYSYIDALLPQKDMTSRFHSEMEKRAQSNQNLLISVFGQQGQGKSYSTIDILSDFATYRGQKFKASNIFFTPTDTLQFVENCARGEIVLNDEQPYTSGLGSGIERMALDNIEMTVRQHGLCFGFVSPKMIEHTYHYAFEVWDWGSDEPLDWTRDWKEQWKYSRLIAYNNKFQKIGFIVADRPSDTKMLEEYEIRKSKFIDDIRGMRGGKRHEFLVRMAFKVLGLTVDENGDTSGELDGEFMKNFVRTRSKSLKTLHVRIALHGKMLGFEELKQLVDYVEFVIETTPDLRNKAMEILVEAGSTMLSIYDEAKMKIKEKAKTEKMEKIPKVKTPKKIKDAVDKVLGDIKEENPNFRTE